MFFSVKLLSDEEEFDVIVDNFCDSKQRDCTLKFYEEFQTARYLMIHFGPISAAGNVVTAK